MIQKLVEKIKIYKEEILSIQKDNVIILKDEHNLLKQIFSDAQKLIENNQSLDLNHIIKSALKEIFFDDNSGVAIISKTQIVLRFKVDKESTFDLMKLLFKDNKTLNKFLYKSIFNYLSKLKLEYLSIENLFNIPKIFANLNSDLIEFVKNNQELHNILIDVQMDLKEIDTKNSPTNLKIKLISEELLRNAINTKYFVEFIVDFLLRNLSTSNTLHLKFMKIFFESEIMRDNEINFATLRKNSVEREKVLKLIDKEEKIIEEANEKVNYFAKLKKDQELKTDSLENEFNEKLQNANEVEKILKESLQKREKLKNDDPKFLEFSTEIKELNSQKSKLDIEVKNLNAKYEIAKQSIINIEQDRSDYLKLLPEIMQTQNEKIDKHIQKLSSYEVEYLKIKSFVTKKLNDKRGVFDFEEFINNLKKVVIDKKYSETIKNKRDDREKRYEGLQVEDLEKLEKEIFSNEEEIKRLMSVIANRSLKYELNFKRITNIYFMDNNIKVIQKYLFELLNKIVKDADDVLIIGFGNFLLRKNFNFILEIEAKTLLTFVMDSDINSENFLSYYDGKLEEDLSGKYKRPEIIDNNNKINPSRVISNVVQYKNYSNFLVKKNNLLKELILKLKNLKDNIDSANNIEESELKKIQDEYKAVLSELSSNKKHKESFVNSQKHIEDIFFNSIVLVAKTLHKKRVKVE